MNWTDVYTAYLEADWREKGKDRKEDCFHCSEIGYCPRKAIFRRIGIKFVPDPGKLRRLRQGTLMHNDWEHGMVEALQGLVDVETQLDEWLPEGWSGTADCVLTIDGGEIIDWKTVNPNAFRYASEFPKEADCLQLGMYWGAYERKTGQTIERGKIIYVPLGVYDDPIEVSVDPSWKDEALRVAAVFDHYWEEYQTAEVLPPPPSPELKTNKKNPAGVWQQSWECSPAYCLLRQNNYCEGGPTHP